MVEQGSVAVYLSAKRTRGTRYQLTELAQERVVLYLLHCPRTETYDASSVLFSAAGDLLSGNQTNFQTGVQSVAPQIRVMGEKIGSQPHYYLDHVLVFYDSI